MKIEQRVFIKKKLKSHHILREKKVRNCSSTAEEQEEQEQKVCALECVGD